MFSFGPVLRKLFCCAPALLASALVIGSASPAFPQTGEVVAAVQQARLSRGGKVSVLNVGTDVAVGDIVATGRNGEAQLIFPDETRIVVGPSSQLKIERLLFRNSTTVRRMSVSALKGTFRFLSGNSPSRAYKVRTPTATMGVRGTAFDFVVSGREATDLLVYDGAVEMCGRRARCVTVPGGCNAIRVDRRAQFVQPETFGARQSLLDRLFPYAGDQEGLQRFFHVPTQRCSTDGGASGDLSGTIRASAPIPTVAVPAAVRSGGGGQLARVPSEARASGSASTASAPAGSKPSASPPSTPSAPSAPPSSPPPATAGP